MFKKNILPLTRKNGALGFFALKNINFWEKALLLSMLIEKMKLKNFPRFGELLKNQINFEK
jgi:hypothetical protein